MVETNEGPTGAIIIDDRYSPLLVVSYFGELQLAQGQWFEQHMQRLIASSRHRERLVTVHDASRSTKTSPEMRKFWAEMSARASANPSARTLADLLVITSAIMRGVITAVGWLNPEVAKMRVFPSLEAALTEATKLLTAAGTGVQLPAGGYSLPRTSFKVPTPA